MIDLVRNALRGFPGSWRLLADFRIERLRLTIHTLLVTDRAVLVFAEDRAAAEKAALDLADFHEGCRSLPVLPVAMLKGRLVVAQDPLPFPGAAPCIACTRLLLPGLLARVAGFPPLPDFDPARWATFPYRPVPALMQAACALYAGHGAASLSLANAGRGALEHTRNVIAALTTAAKAEGRKQIVFVTGQPGAGKTLCGLDIAFAPGATAAFLTGNPALLHVLRAALVRDAAAKGMGSRAAAQRIAAVVQPLHGFRDQYAAGGVPPDRVLVIDEAQRCWNTAHAVRKTRNKPVRLTQSEPGHMLDIMGRRDGFCLVLCLLGGGQEIHVGEGGLAEWGLALAAHPQWHAAAPPGALHAADPRQRLPALPRLVVHPALHLGEAVRTYTAPRGIAWVDAVLRSDANAARAIAGPDLPISLTRSLDTMRWALRQNGRQAGLVASSGGRRLRAEGLGGLLWHQDEDAVARWFLDRWPDIRSAEALEVAATEFGVQGLELDHVGVCWDLDLHRDPGGSSWLGRAFRATSWSRPLGGEALSNKLNTYRVLLTRARRRAVIWVPRGDVRDPSRSPARYDAVADFLRECGLGTLDAAPVQEQHAFMTEPALL